MLGSCTGLLGWLFESTPYKALKYSRNEPNSQFPIFHLCSLEPVIFSLYETLVPYFLKGKVKDQATKI